MSQGKTVKKKELFVVAGEESANQYALKLLKAFKKDPDFENMHFSGIAFKSMKSHGFDLVYDAAAVSYTHLTLPTIYSV